MPRYKIPYTAPGSLGGHLVVTAAGVAEAVLKAEKIHRRAYQTNVGGALRQFSIPTRKRLEIEYGEPELLPPTEGEQRDADLERALSSRSDGALARAIDAQVTRKGRRA